MLTAVLVIVGWVAAYLVLREALKRRCEDLRREFQDQINMLHTKMRLLAPSAGSDPGIVSPTENTSQDPKPAEPIASAPPADVAPEIPPETMAVIAETVSGFLGKRVRIRSAKKLPAPTAQAGQASSENAEPWAQQGRVLVQTSHESVQTRTTGTPAQPAPSSLRGVVLENTDPN